MEREREKMGVKRKVEDSGATRRRREREIGERTKKRVKGKGRGCGHALRGWVKKPGQGQSTVDAKGRSQALGAIVLQQSKLRHKQLKYPEREEASHGKSLGTNERYPAEAT